MPENTGCYFYRGAWHCEEWALPITPEKLMKSPGFDEFYYLAFVRKPLDAVIDLIYDTTRLVKIFFEISGIVMGVTVAVNMAFPNTITKITAGMTTIGSKIQSLAIQAGSDLIKAGGSIIDAVVTVFKNFLELIHFHELLRVHNILYQLLPKYREAVNFIYYRISRVSEAIGFDAQFINLALRNARAVVLTASSMIGRPYDLAELDWWNNYDKLTEKINNDMSKYEDNPEALFQDIDEWIIRDSQDQMAGSQTSILSGVDAALQKVDTVITDVVTLRNEVGQFQEQLPEEVQKYTRPIIDPVLNRFDTFYYNDYAPTMQAIGVEVGENRQNIEINKQKVDMLNLRIDTSDIYIGRWDDLTPDQQEEQQTRLEQRSTANFQNDTDNLTSISYEREQALQKEAESIPEIPTKEYTKPEPMKKQNPPVKRPSLPKAGWFVGDY